MKFKKSFGCRVLTGGVLSFLIGLVIVGASKMLLSGRLSGEPYSYLRYYYDFVNYVHKGVSQMKSGGDIVIIDTHDEAFGSRAGFARLMDSLAVLSPRAVGIDQIFPRTNESTAFEDSLLKRAVERFPHPLVTACRHYGRDSLEHSFFTIDSKVDFGIVNGQSFYAFSPSDTVKGRPVERLVVILAKKAGFYDSNVSVVDYSNRSFLTLSKWEDVNEDNVKNKVILIGDIDNAKDSVDLPFKIEGKYSASGVLLNAYQLHSLMDKDSSFRRMSLWLSLLICFCLTVVYAFLAGIWTQVKAGWLRTRKEPVTRRILTTVFLIGEPLALLFVEALALWGMVLAIGWGREIPNLLVFVAAAPFIGRCLKVAKIWVRNS